MTQHDYNIANQTFSAFRTDINNAFASILSVNSGASAPTTTVAGMLWYDTTNGLIKQRNAGDSAWVTLWRIAGGGLVAQDGAEIYAADAGGSDTYAITLSPAPTAYATGMVINFKANTANTGAATLNINSLGAKTLKKSKDVDLQDNDIKAGQIITVIYDGTNFQVVSPLNDLYWVTNLTAITSPADGDLIPIADASDSFKTRYITKANLFGTGGYPTGYISGKPPKYNSASSIVIPTGLKARNSTDSTDMTVASDLTVSLASSGANGLDSGTEASNTWYYVYLIYNGTTVAGLLSTVNESNTGSITLPGGYTTKRQLPIAIRNDGSSNIIPFFVAEGWPCQPKITYNVVHGGGGQTVGPTNVIDGGTSSTYALVACASYVPPIAEFGFLRMQTAQTSSPQDTWIKKQGGSEYYQIYKDGERYMGEVVMVELDSNQQAHYKTTGTVDISVFGYLVTKVV